jgi:hypothetical protein
MLGKECFTTSSIRDIIKQLMSDEVQLGVTCSQMLESLNLLVDDPKSIFQYSCAVAGLPETLRVMMGQPESIGAAAFLILVRSGGGSGRDEVSEMIAQVLLTTYRFEDPAAFFAQAELQFKVLNGFGRARGYSFSSDVNASLFTVNYQKMWCLSKIEACLIRHRQEGSSNANAQYVMEIYHLMKAEFDKDPACYGDLLGFTAEFSRRLNSTLFKGAESSTVINVNAAKVQQKQPRVPNASVPVIPRSKETPDLQFISILRSYADFNKMFVWLDAGKTKCRIKKNESMRGLVLMRIPDNIYHSWPNEVKDVFSRVRAESFKFYKEKHREETGLVPSKADPIDDGQVKKKRQNFQNKNKKHDSVNNKKNKIDPDTVVNAADFAAYQSVTEKRLADLTKALEKANSSHAGGSNAAGSN